MAQPRHGRGRAYGAKRLVLGFPNAAAGDRRIGAPTEGAPRAGSMPTCIAARHSHANQTRICTASSRVKVSARSVASCEQAVSREKNLSNTNHPAICPSISPRHGLLRVRLIVAINRAPQFVHMPSYPRRLQPQGHHRPPAIHPEGLDASHLDGTTALFRCKC